MTLPLPTSHAKLLLPAAALAAALGAAWWLAPASVERHGTVVDSSAHDTAAPSDLNNASRVWGQPSPFARGPAASSTFAPDSADEFAADVRRFEDLRAHVAERSQPDPELIQLARALQFDLPQHLQRGDLSGTEALLLAGAMLEIIEPDADARAQQLARLAAQVLPPT